ncbi:TetR/AcrR family transcriptional regulator [Puniceicoccaceae bacterium K14]|nr:TetR/AcrR family transcriptional regulator [Puniceicoccaceae bacterium K14]
MVEAEDIPSEESTRSKILRTALELFHQGSFNGTSVNQIVVKAGITKGALFHYFKGKNELGYAIVDELLRESVQENWVFPLATSDDPIGYITELLRAFEKEMQETPEMVECGCPLNNLSQEMSSMDSSFRLRLRDVYQEWEDCLDASLRRGIEAGKVRKGIDPAAVAKVLISVFQGSIGMMKVHQTREFSMGLKEGLIQILDQLKP